MNQYSVKQEEDQCNVYREYVLLPEFGETEELILSESLFMGSPPTHSLDPSYMMNPIYNNNNYPCTLIEEYMFQPPSVVDYIKPENISLPLSSLFVPDDSDIHHNLFDTLVKTGTSEPPIGSTEKREDPKKKKKKTFKKGCCSLQKKKKITAYDTETTAYLQSVFFEAYSKQSKLTKQQRREVQEKTGLPSRNITYWFSNHKRRFQGSLNLFKQVTEKSSVTTYNDFIKWRRKHGLPDKVSRDELRKH